MVVKELYPIVAATRANGARWRGRTIVAGTDNTGVVFGLNAGRVHTHRGRRLMRELGDLMQEHQLEIIGAWVPRELNVVADCLSRRMSLRVAVATAYPSDADQLSPPAPACKRVCRL